MIMICVVEYGKHIGTLRNLFPDEQQALAFAQRIIALSEGEYQSIGPRQWYCREKKEFVKIEAMRN
jgi:ABC-type Fe3+/spermidine/putrescine transport system ATPase subunit